jgi:hypothetical protein
MLVAPSNPVHQHLQRNQLDIYMILSSAQGQLHPNNHDMSYEMNDLSLHFTAQPTADSGSSYYEHQSTINSGDTRQLQLLSHKERVTIMNSTAAGAAVATLINPPC